MVVFSICKAVCKRLQKAGTFCFIIKKNCLSSSRPAPQYNRGETEPADGLAYLGRRPNTYQPTVKSLGDL
jgi:hypothetical protein